jgi:ubiquinone/menaquinone biosynthesis C-methylase UbiE
MDGEREGAQKRWEQVQNTRGEDYDAPYTARAARGENVHGEADFVEALQPHTVLDAGCGTGRVAIELARRGRDVVGVDINAGMLNRARQKAPRLSWHLADLATIRLPRRFDVVLMAGNVMIFVEPGTEATVVQNMARHLAPGGALVAGFQLSVGYLSVATYDELANAAGLALAERYSTWDRAPWTEASTYAVSVHRRR